MQAFQPIDDPALDELAEIDPDFWNVIQDTIEPEPTPDDD